MQKLVEIDDAERTVLKSPIYYDFLKCEKCGILLCYPYIINSQTGKFYLRMGKYYSLDVFRHVYCMFCKMDIADFVEYGVTHNYQIPFIMYSYYTIFKKKAYMVRTKMISCRSKRCGFCFMSFVIGTERIPRYEFDTMNICCQCIVDYMNYWIGKAREFEMYKSLILTFNRKKRLSRNMCAYLLSFMLVDEWKNAPYVKFNMEKYLLSFLNNENQAFYKKYA